MRPLCLLAGFAIALATAAAPGEDRSRQEAAEAERLCADELARWKLTAADRALENLKDPVLRWTNPAAGRVYGNTYVWLQDGRPLAVGCLFRNFQPYNTFIGELTALAGNRLVATRDGKALWGPADEWKWHPLPGSPAPAAAAPQRLFQVRALAAEFTVELLDTRNVPRGEDQTPRLLPKPLYRYDAKKTKTLDGGLFAFVLGTDPELMVLIECDLAAEKPAWRFGVGRMNRDTIRLKRKGKTVWEAQARREHHPEDAYYFFGLGLSRKESQP